MPTLNFHPSRLQGAPHDLVEETFERQDSLSARPTLRTARLRQQVAVGPVSLSYFAMPSSPAALRTASQSLA